MPRPDASSAFISAVTSQYVRPAFLVQIGFTTGTVYVWSGVGSLSYGGNTYQGVGTFGGISTIEEGSNVQARGIVLSLSGFNASLLTDVLSDYQQGLPAVVYFGCFDATGTTFLGVITAWAGLTDQPTITVTGETASIEIACENVLVEMNTSVERRYTTEDQQIDYPGDRGFDYMPQIATQTVYFGHHPASSPGNLQQGYSAG